MREAPKNNWATERRLGIELRRTFVVEHPHGLHARPASVLATTLAPYQCLVHAQCNGETVNAKSVLGLMSLGAGFCANMAFTATGDDALQAVDAIEKLFKSRFNGAY